MSDFKEIIGAKVWGYRMPNDAEVVLTLEDGRKATFTLDADCCSQSFFTKESQWKDLVGATIRAVEDRDGDEEDDDEIVTKWHFLVFTTDKGHATIDWRNDSNGYYDGSVNLEVK